VLRGDEVGALLADHILRRTDADPDAGRRLVVSSLVSSQLLAGIAAAHGVTHRETLTGFKWIMRAVAALPDHRFVFGYEEALGYAVTDAVRDKDGVSAAVTFVEMVADLAAAGETVTGRLEQLALAHGRHLTGQVTLRFDDPAALSTTMAALRRDLPSRLGDVAVAASDDLLHGDGRGGPGADIVRLWLADGSRVIVRPSGTEPKVKCYLEVVGEPGEPAATTAGRLATLDAAVRKHLGVR
jgi:phosphomannomutase